jgi:hypothetical protein
MTAYAVRGEAPTVTAGPVLAWRGTSLSVPPPSPLNTPRNNTPRTFLTTSLPVPVPVTTLAHRAFRAIRVRRSPR